MMETVLPAPPPDPIEVDLQQIANQIPAIPSDFTDLRALQNLIQPPVGTDAQPARADDLPSPAGGALGLPSVVGNAPSQQSGASLGVVAALFYGKTNLLVDPMFERTGRSNPVPLTTPAPTAAAEWQAHYTKASGTAPTGRQWAAAQLASDTLNPTNSRAAQVTTSGWAGAADVSFFIRQKTGTVIAAGVPFLVGAARFVPGAGNVTGITTMTVAVEVVDGAGTVLATSTVLDWLSFASATATRQLIAIVNAPGAGTYYLRFNIHIVSGAGTSGSTAPGMTVAEPQLTLSQVQLPPPFAPIVGGWIPNQLRYVDDPVLTDNPFDVLGISDTVARHTVNALGELLWGSGAATEDVRLFRFAAGALHLETNGVTATSELGTNSKSGSASKLTARVASEANPRAVLEGDATIVGLLLGPGGATAPDWQLSRTAANKAALGSGDTLDLSPGTVILPSGKTPPQIASGSGTFTWSAALDSGTQTVSFPFTFAAAPNVVLVLENSLSRALRAVVLNGSITTSQFQCVGQATDGVNKTGSVIFYWVAVNGSTT